MKSNNADEWNYPEGSKAVSLYLNSNHGDLEAIGEGDSRYNIGDLIDGRYELRQVHQGGMGVVYLCYDVKNKLPFALKTFQDKYLASPKAKDRFIQEANVWIQLDFHVNIVHAEMVERIEGKPYISLQCVLGVDGTPVNLASKLREGRLKTQTALKYAMQICLGFIHVQFVRPGLVHRDIKPTNIMISDNDVAKITDFGIFSAAEIPEAVALSEVEKAQLPVHTQTGVVLGTYGYMSPEQEQNKALDPRSDIYCFGLLLYEMLAGERFTDSKRRLSTHNAIFRSLEKNYKKNLVQIIRRCLEEDISKRFQSFYEVGVSLDEYYRATFRESLFFDHGTKSGPGEAVITENLSFIAAAEYASGKNVDDLKGLFSYRKWIIEENRSREALLEEGDSYLQLGKFGPALDCFEKIIKSDLKLLDDPGRDRSDCKQALSVDFLYRGIALRNLSHTQEAVRAFNEAVSYDPSNSNAWYNLGECLFNNLHDLQGALVAYQKTLELDPGDTWAWNSMGVVLINLEQDQKALDCFNRALNKDSRFVMGLLNKACLLYKMDQLKDALTYFEKVTQIDPSVSMAWFNKGVLEFQGNRELGIRDIQRAIELEPSDPQYRQALAELMKQ